jgi:capsular exopolysaccharide synthesis family protein
LGESLGSIESNIKEYKIDHEITDLEFETSESIARLSDFKKELSQASIQLELGRLMQNHLKKSSSTELIPTNLGFEDFAIENAIISHNELVLSLIKEMKNSNNKNPRLVNLEKQISNIKESIRLSVNNLVEGKKKIIDESYAPMNYKKGRLMKFPEYEKVLRELNRNQKLKEEIFLYLLKKKEENKLAGAIITDKGVMVQNPYVDIEPVSPDKIKIYSLSTLLAFLAFIIIVYLKFQYKNIIERKEDIINAGLNLIGTISHNTENEYLVVKNGKKNKINEDFRKIRTSLVFSLQDQNKDNSCPLICVTSHSPSEGKSFCSLNLSVSFSLVGKKVLLVDLDLRAPSLNSYLNVSNDYGLSDFLINNESDIFNIITQPLESTNFFFINSGTIAPNPSELIMSNKFKNILIELRNHFDIIVLDTPPISLVTDTSLILKMTDINLFISRNNYSRYEFLENIKNILVSGNFKNAYFIFNDEKYAFIQKYGYGYGYVYDEGYGSNYYVDEFQVKRVWWNPFTWFKS